MTRWCWLWFCSQCCCMIWYANAVADVVDKGCFLDFIPELKMYSWAKSLDQDAPDLCEPEGPRGPGVALQQRDAVSGRVLQEQELRWPCLCVQVTLYEQSSSAVLNVAEMARSSVTRPCSRACHQLCGECSRWGLRTHCSLWHSFVYIKWQMAYII